MHETIVKKAASSTCFLGLFFEPEDGGSLFLENVS
jgi:hypothetical protein